MKARFHEVFNDNGAVRKTIDGEIDFIPSVGMNIVISEFESPYNVPGLPVRNVSFNPVTKELDVYLSNGCLSFDPLD